VVQLLLVVLLAVHLGLGMDAAWRMSVTHDEYWHLPIGLVNLTSGRLEFDAPPMLRAWSALPLLFTSAKAPPFDAGIDRGEYGDRFLRDNREHYRLWFFLGRCMNVLLSVATAGVLALATWEWLGRGASLLAVLLYALHPTTIAHSAVVTADTGAALFFVLVAFLTWRFARRATWSGALGLGAAMGAAQLTKFTLVILIPLSLAMWWLARAGRTGEKAEDPSSAGGEISPSVPGQKERMLSKWLAAVLACLLVWNAGYLFRGTGSLLGSYPFQSRSLKGVAERWPALAWVPVPLPRDYVLGVDSQQKLMESPHPGFLDGQWHLHGVRHYYLMALWYKSPHGWQVLVLLGGLMMMRGREAGYRRVLCFILLLSTALLVVAGLGGLQLGVRYVLPVVPMLCVVAGAAATWCRWRRSRWRTVAVGALILWTAWAVRFHPHHLAYFNELAGGPEGGHRHLLDSNLDWGQDLDRLKLFLDESPIEEIGLAYFGMIPPGELGIDFHLPPSWEPRPGWYAVSVNFVHGRPHMVRDVRGGSRPVDLDEYGYFRLFEPVKRIGYSIYVYRLTEWDMLRWQAAVSAVVDEPRHRRVTFDCPPTVPR
jgi:hypothetical protein